MSARRASGQQNTNRMHHRRKVNMGPPYSFLPIVIVRRRREKSSAALGDVLGSGMEIPCGAWRQGEQKGSFDCGCASLREAQSSLRMTDLEWIASFVAEGFGGEGSACGPRWIEGRNEGDSDRDHGYQETIRQAGGEGDVVDGVDLGRERNHVVVASGIGDAVAEQQADGGADDADEDPLSDEDVAYLRAA